MFTVNQIQLSELSSWSVRTVRHGAQCVCLSVCGTAATRAAEGVGRAMASKWPDITETRMPPTGHWPWSCTTPYLDASLLWCTGWHTPVPISPRGLIYQEMHVNPHWCHSFCWSLKHGAFVTTGLDITQHASVQPITRRLYLQADGTYGWNDEPLKEQFNSQMEHFVIIYSPSCHFKPVWLEIWDFRAVMEEKNYFQ